MGWVVLLLVAVGGTVVLTYIVAMHRRALARLQAGAERLAEGDLRQRVAVHSPLQVARVADAINRMAGQLSERLSTVVSQRNELQAVLRSMAEGVLVVDLEERVKSLNRAAAHLLGVDSAAVVGRRVLEVVRDTGLQRVIERILRSDAPVEDEVELRVMSPTNGDAPEGRPIRRALEARSLQVQGSALVDGSSRRIGAVVVLNDVTRLRRLESMRRDFVANVSHEIKTPVAAIKAAVETLLQSPDATPEDANRFLKMTVRQADRLQAIIDDLLSLARIERDSEETRIELHSRRVHKLLRAAVETCSAQAEAKEIELAVLLEQDMRASLNGAMIEQAVVNLLDNAIKYSGPNTRIEVDAQRTAEELIITVRDQGSGIAAEHLPRLFERFYRTDKARSRALGGTGLGLAIVKHITQAHGGHVSVESKLGEGSTFRLHLPVRDDERSDSDDDEFDNFDDDQNDAHEISGEA